MKDQLLKCLMDLRYGAYGLPHRVDGPAIEFGSSTDDLWLFAVYLSTGFRGRVSTGLDLINDISHSKDVYCFEGIRVSQEHLEKIAARIRDRENRTKSFIKERLIYARRKSGSTPP